MNYDWWLDRQLWEYHRECERQERELQGLDEQQPEDLDYEWFPCLLV